jgi:uncharacterized Zn finger protein (UPF0148 family)
MNIKDCEICGLAFKALTLGQKYCPECSNEMYKSSAGSNEEKAKPKKNPNQKLIDEVKAAAKAGLSYGNYKGRGK